MHDNSTPDERATPTISHDKPDWLKWVTTGLTPDERARLCSYEHHDED